MSVQLNKVIGIMEKIAPARLKEEYDNVGLMIGDRNSIIKSILITLDCTLDVIEEAVEKQCDLIISHHPILFKKPSSITRDSLVGKKLIKLIQSNINVYASHTNLDVTKNGLNEIVVDILGFGDSSIMDVTNNLSNGDEVGVGRLVELDKEMLLSELCDMIKSKLGLDNLKYCGENDWTVKRIAIINGSGQDYFSIAKRLKADCIITGDTSYHYVSDFYEDKIAIIDAGHFGTEWPAMKYFGLKLKEILKENKIDVEVHISEKNKDPYKFI